MSKSSTQMNKTKRLKLRHPACPKCGYNLTGAPRDEQQYLCSECGVTSSSIDVHFAPIQVGQVFKPLVIAIAPPLLATLVGYFMIFVTSSGDMQVELLNLWMVVSFFLNLWFVPVALYYTAKVAVWKGPNDWNGPLLTLFYLGVGSASIVFTGWLAMMAIATSIN